MPNVCIRHGCLSVPRGNDILTQVGNGITGSHIR